MLKNTNLTNDQLVAIEASLNSYLFKQPESGENWHSSYKDNKESFDLLAKQTAALERIVRSFFLKQKADIEQLVSLSKTAWSKQNQKLANALADGIFPIYTNGARAQAAAFKTLTPITASAVNSPAQKFLTDYTLQLASDLNDTTQANIKQAIQTSLALGESRDELTNRINDLIDNPYRAQMIAQTESVRAFNQGRLAVGREYGYESKQWDAVPDACPNCADLDGVIVGIDELFPSDLGDVDSPPLHPNCRCGDHLIKVAPADAENADVSAKEMLRTIYGDDYWFTAASGAHVHVVDGVIQNKAPAKTEGLPKSPLEKVEAAHMQAYKYAINEKQIKTAQMGSSLNDAVTQGQLTRAQADAQYQEYLKGYPPIPYADDDGRFISQIQSTSVVGPGMVTPDAMDMLISQGYTPQDIGKLEPAKVVEVNDLATQFKNENAQAELTGGNDFNKIFDPTLYQGLSQDELNAKVQAQVADVGVGLSNITNDYNWEVQSLPIGSIQKVPIDPVKVATYASSMRSGETFPLALVTHVGNAEADFSTIDGNHRLEAASQEGAKNVAVLVGTLK